jgi:hypothetical protein
MSRGDRLHQLGAGLLFPSSQPKSRPHVEKEVEEEEEEGEELEEEEDDDDEFSL